MAVHGNAPLNLDYRALIEHAVLVETRSNELRWWVWERYSSRQQRKIELGGLIGEIEYVSKVIQEFLPLVIAGELLHAGADSSFGLGRYRILT